MRITNLLRFTSAAALVGGIITSGVALSGTAGADGHDFGGGHQSHAHALFVETDALSGNSVISYLRGSDGTISLAGQYPTGGNGGAGANSSAAPLGSEYGLVLVNHDSELIATNAGSNTVTVFAVDGTKLDAIQQISSGGLFPNSVASYGNLITVLNAGGAGSVQEFNLQNGKLVALVGENRSLGLANTTPPDYVHGAGQVGYTPNGQHLVVTTKHSTDSFEVFSVGANGNLGAVPVITAANNPVPYDFNFDTAGRLFGLEAGTSSASVYTVNTNGSLTSLGTIADGQAALCWISSANGYFYGSNAGSGTITSFDESASGVPQIVTSIAATAHAGTTDSVISPDNKFLFVESGGAGTIDSYAIGSNGSLTQVATVFNIPKASEGLAIS
jgi:6-phosphogluconolactonase (cycloisomerase 2 family)